MSAPGFVWRIGMELDLSSLSEKVEVPEGLRIEPWRESYVEALVEVIHLAYAQTDEPRWSPGLRRRQGCVTMAKIHPDDQPWSWVLLRGDEPVGLIHGANTKGQKGYVDNVCVHPALARGGGRALLLTTAWSFRREGLQRLWLDVTASNTRAVKLYESVGFVDRKWYLELTKP